MRAWEGQLTLTNHPGDKEQMEAWTLMEASGQPCPLRMVAWQAGVNNSTGQAKAPSSRLRPDTKLNLNLLPFQPIPQVLHIITVNIMYLGYTCKCI